MLPYRVDYFTSKHIKILFFTFEEADRFANAICLRKDIKHVFLLKLFDKETGIYDDIIQYK